MLGEELEVYTKTEYIDQSSEGEEKYKVSMKEGGELYLFVDGSSVHSDPYREN